ncbi:hypothetical protein SAMN05216565_103242 [Litchfieldia salsa]|uniref:Uncharacterized protein n=1 Tax=Litchfieldia salsa TaxID=930152 RepID=A0A1H0T332_9BACI|nr:hypothetical protein SAMN05216565_103242 [Litchfieldia salsa]
MLLSGIVSFVAMYLSAPFLAELVIDSDDQTGNSIEDVEFVIRLVSFAFVSCSSYEYIQGIFPRKPIYGTFGFKYSD